MDEEHISRLLRDLPREEASASFTAGVLRRVRSADEPWWRPRYFALAACAAVVLVVGVWGARTGLEDRARERERLAAMARLEVLEARKQALEAEIRDLRQLARDAQGVVYLGSTPYLDVVVDLRRLAERQRPAKGPEAASTRLVTNPRR